ncbi:MAG: condensation domain-containing protein, partial [Acidobacteriota bacterium]
MKLANVEDIYKLSPVQQGMLFHTLYQPETGAYFEQTVIPLGSVDVATLRRAWQQLPELHPVLRTSFLWKDLDEPVQVVHRQVALPVREEDWTHLEASEQRQRLQAYCRDDRQRGFELTRAPLMRLALIHLSDGLQLVLSYHHLLLDGWSRGLLMSDFMALYQAAARGEKAVLEPRRPFREYVRWLASQDLAEAERYWRRVLAGLTSPTPLGIDRGSDRASGSAEDFRRPGRRLPSAVHESLVAFARRHDLTRATLVSAAWAVLLSRYSGREDVVFGITVSGRSAELPGVESMIGCFINTLPARFRPAPCQQVVRWLKQLQSEQLELRKYEYSPLVEIHQWSAVAPDQPLFESIVVFQDGAANEEQDSFDRTNYPLSLEVWLEPHGITVEAAFDRSRFEPAPIARMMRHLEIVLERLAEEPRRRLGELTILAAAERHQLLVEWNSVEITFPRELCADQLIAAQAERTPDAPAVSDREVSRTYRQLNRRANRLARALVAQGIGRGSLVALYAERSAEFLTAMLAIFKAGAAYLPLDPLPPATRRLRVLEQSRAEAVVVARDLAPDLREALAGSECRPQVLELEELLQQGGSGENLSPRSGPDDLAYVLYTSGSTGRPKGAMVHHRGMLNHLFAKIVDLQLERRDIVAQTASQLFDISLWQFLAPLVAGGETRVFHDQETHDPVRLLETVERTGTTVLEPVPSMMRYWLEELEEQGTERPALAALRWVVPTGEALP